MCRTSGKNVISEVKMSSVEEVEVTCAVCGHKSKQILSSPPDCMGDFDLDMRPSKEIYNLSGRIMECPNCLYASENIGEATPDVISFIESGEYMEAFDSEVGKVASAYNNSASLNFIKNDLKGAMMDYLHAAWACDDNNNSSGSELYRITANELLCRYGDKMDIDEDAKVCIQADIARRLCDFERVIELHSNYRSKNMQIQGILDFQYEMAVKKDAKCYKISQALAPIDDEFRDDWQDKINYEKSKKTLAPSISKENEMFLEMYKESLKDKSVDELKKELEMIDNELNYEKDGWNQLIYSGEDMKIVQEMKYVVMTDKKKRVIVAVKERDGEPESPCIIYDGKEHAQFRRNPNLVILLDYVNKDMHERLFLADTVFVVELKDKKTAVRTYKVPVVRVDEMPEIPGNMITTNDIIDEKNSEL